MQSAMPGLLHRALMVLKSISSDKRPNGHGTSDAKIENMKTKILTSIVVAGFTAMCYAAGGSAGGASGGAGGAAGTPGASGIGVPGNIPGPNGTTVGSSPAAKHTVRALPKRINTPGMMNNNANVNGTVNQNGNVSPTGTVTPNATINNANGTVNPNGTVYNPNGTVKVPSHKVVTRYGNLPANNNKNDANNPPNEQK